MATKYIGFGMTYQLYGQLAITIVPANCKEEAGEMLEALQLPVKDYKHIRQVSIFRYPGPKADVLDWEKMMQPIQEYPKNKDGSND